MSDVSRSSNRHHWGFYDPAQATDTVEEKLAVFRRVRDEIKVVFETIYTSFGGT